MNSAFVMKQPVTPRVSTALAAVLACALAASAGPLMAASIPSEQEQGFTANECGALLARRHDQHILQLAKVLVQSQGMRLVVQACPFVRTASDGIRQVLDVRVFVVDSDAASQFVRGPLADGEEVDMGGVLFALPTLARAAQPAPQDDVSPDVQFNRDWLASVMKQCGWRTVPTHWWAFVSGQAP